MPLLYIFEAKNLLIGFKKKIHLIAFGKYNIILQCRGVSEKMKKKKRYKHLTINKIKINMCQSVYTRYTFTFRASDFTSFCKAVFAH